jgi:hypothetical protein
MNNQRGNIEPEKQLIWHGTDGEKFGERYKWQSNRQRTVASFPRAFDPLVPVFLTGDQFDTRKIYVCIPRLHGCGPHVCHPTIPSQTSKFPLP